jgi:hypothetical protein
MSQSIFQMACFDCRVEQRFRTKFCRGLSCAGCSLCRSAGRPFEISSRRSSPVAACCGPDIRHTDPREESSRRRNYGHDTSQAGALYELHGEGTHCSFIHNYSQQDHGTTKQSSHLPATCNTLCLAEP